MQLEYKYGSSMILQFRCTPSEVCVLGLGASWYTCMHISGFSMMMVFMCFALSMQPVNAILPQLAITGHEEQTSGGGRAVGKLHSGGKQTTGGGFPNDSKCTTTKKEGFLGATTEIQVQCCQWLFGSKVGLPNSSADVLGFRTRFFRGALVPRARARHLL